MNLTKKEVIILTLVLVLINMSFIYLGYANLKALKLQEELFKSGLLLAGVI